MKVALVHDWLVTLAGAEKVLEALYELYPAHVFTLVADKKGLEGSPLADARINTSFIQGLPWAKRLYRNYLALFPLAVEQFDLSGYDVVISVSTCAAKGVLTRADQLHVCYCCTPVRYAWDLYHQYLNETGLKRGLKGKLARLVLHYIRMWDSTTANRVDCFVTLSHYVSRRIRKTYGRESTVIYPPVDVDGFQPRADKEDFYLAASRMVPYKRMDLIAKAFSNMPGRKLVVIGDGPELEKVKSRAASNVEVLGYQPFEVLRDYMQRAKAFVFAAEEDFGIVPVEAQACGTPVIAYGRGGARETVIDGETGIFFHEQTPEAIAEAIGRFEQHGDGFDPETMRKNAERFSKKRFQEEFRGLVEKLVSRSLGPPG